MSLVTDSGSGGHLPETMHARGVIALLVMGAFACGGKILEDPDSGAANAQNSATSSAGPNTTATATATTEPKPPPPSPSADLSMSDACHIVCQRNGRCGGADQVDCEQVCMANAKSTCAASHIAFTKCFARNLDQETCAMVPPSCESDYCAYARCADKPTLDYCE